MTAALFGRAIELLLDRFPSSAYLFTFCGVIQRSNLKTGLQREPGRAKPSNVSVPVRFLLVELSLKITAVGDGQGGDGDEGDLEILGSF